MHHMNCSRTPIKSISKGLLSPHRRGLPVCGSSNMSMIRSLASFYRRKVYLLGQHGPRSHGIIVRHTQGPATLNRERRNHCTKMYVHSESSTDADVRQPSSHRPPPRSPLSTWYLSSSPLYMPTMMQKPSMDFKPLSTIAMSQGKMGSRVYANSDTAILGKEMEDLIENRRYRNPISDRIRNNRQAVKRGLNLFHFIR